MITNDPITSILDSTATTKSHYDKASEALYMTRCILGVVGGATDSDFNGAEIYSGDISGAIAAALFLAGMAQDHMDSLHVQLLSPSNEASHEVIG